MDLIAITIHSWEIRLAHRAAPSRKAIPAAAATATNIPPTDLFEVSGLVIADEMAQRRLVQFVPR
jgi:hypothetical protein